MAMKITEQKWKKDLGSILEDLKNDEYRKLLSLLDMITAEKKGRTDLPEMPQLIIQTYGLERSISVIKKAMDDIPRKDGSIQNRLVPYVNKLKEIKQAKKNEGIKTGAQTGNKQQTSAKPSGLKRKPMSPQARMLSGGPKAKKKKTEKKNPSETQISAALKTAPSGQQKLKPKTQKKARPPKPVGSTKAQSVKNKPSGSDRPKKKMAKKKSESQISSLFSVQPQVRPNFSVRGLDEPPTFPGQRKYPAIHWPTSLSPSLHHSYW